MEEIIKSIIDGERRKAIQQLKESGYLLEDLFEELMNRDMVGEIIAMYRVAVSVGYIKF